ncbi:transposase [Haloimpatiens lingqiaonensis]|uniref:transposase n=1 Tax=Haloimpatiens lingqiaonensis TaxID=1380675 RepID=UPI0014852CB9|nr:transposase [Haloimpatiens lingqiaonensis]
MPRFARLKEFLGTYHIMLKSMSEIYLFKTPKDKDKFLQILNKYKTIYKIEIYAYCLMDTHVHILIYSKGADISKFMHGVNLSYALYYNKKYKRKGHVFSDRFKSKLILDEIYLLNCSSYIHNNPKDIKKYRGNVENYCYSSLGIYLGKLENKYDLINTRFILSLFSKDLIKSRILYTNFLKNAKNIELSSNFTLSLKKNSSSSDCTLDINYDCMNNRTSIPRDYDSNKIINFVKKNIYSGKVDMLDKNSYKNFKSLCIVLLKCLCNLTYNEIGECLNIVNIYDCYKLCNNGVFLIQTKHNDIVEKFLQYAK